MCQIQRNMLKSCMLKTIDGIVVCAIDGSQIMIITTWKDAELKILYKIIKSRQNIENYIFNKLKTECGHSYCYVNAGNAILKTNTKNKRSITSMKKQNTKKLITMLLALIMVICIVPMDFVRADGETISGTITIITEDTSCEGIGEKQYSRTYTDKEIGDNIDVEIPIIQGYYYNDDSEDLIFNEGASKYEVEITSEDQSL